MKRIMVTAFIAIAAFVAGASNCNAKSVSKSKTKKINTYFSKVLKGEKADYKYFCFAKLGNGEFSFKEILFG